KPGAEHATMLPDVSTTIMKYGRAAAGQSAGLGELQFCATASLALKSEPAVSRHRRGVRQLDSRVSKAGFLRNVPGLNGRNRAQRNHPSVAQRLMISKSRPGHKRHAGRPARPTSRRPKPPPQAAAPSRRPKPPPRHAGASELITQTWAKEPTGHHAAGQ